MLTASTTGRPGAAQQVGDRPVLRRQPGAAVDEEQRRRRLRRSPARVCFAISCRMPVLRHRLEAAGVDDEERAVADAPAAVVAVAREAREVGDQRGARARQPVEQRRLADVGAADDDEGGQHRGGCQPASVGRGRREGARGFGWRRARSRALRSRVRARIRDPGCATVRRRTPRRPPSPVGCRDQRASGVERPVRSARPRWGPRPRVARSPAAVGAEPPTRVPSLRSMRCR